MSTSTRLALVVLSVLALFSLYHARADHQKAGAHWGTPVHNGAADREVVIDSNTKAINVRRMETVRFVVRNDDGKQDSFMWRFDGTQSGPAPIDLNRVAPAGVLGRPIKVYVSSQPSEHMGLTPALRSGDPWCERIATGMLPACSQD